MKLTELNARFIGAGGDGIYNADGSPARERHGVGVIMDCPCRAPNCDLLFVPFKNPVDGGEPYDKNDKHTWQRMGDSIETLTLAPSVQRMNKCQWHGFIIDGEARVC